uniref:Uncharacterized protein n=1 Tax=Calcidiscus leptoporus TaxID=127549 RepID=A0A7S0P7A8_9EUKA|mmetsp:Transcript_9845/g.22731  ORF Transcript_9845/g.22731 Transcript_9845/m.22731 type:complete len:211 (+) Transcript_9845:101-733(+)
MRKVLSEPAMGKRLSRAQRHESSPFRLKEAGCGASGMPRFLSLPVLVAIGLLSLVCSSVFGIALLLRHTDQFYPSVRQQLPGFRHRQIGMKKLSASLQHQADQEAMLGASPALVSSHLPERKLLEEDIRTIHLSVEGDTDFFSWVRYVVKSPDKIAWGDFVQGVQERLQLDSIDRIETRNGEEIISTQDILNNDHLVVHSYHMHSRLDTS